MSTSGYTMNRAAFFRRVDRLTGTASIGKARAGNREALWSCIMWLVRNSISYYAPHLKQAF